MPAFYQGALIAIAFRKTAYLQNMYKISSDLTSDIAVGVHKITDSKH
ncbi:hypothetical protein [Nostoc favosum]|uniref:Uncharacterized protein n=1 Tax=Nostoc favosum CHAB5714 TaxID=2780399 RepID=A0ABS8I363_9NOSO|nr:hypothetical protein [Nostoc favosum]MCC5598617.1 hypothetical protein [Nostoc favosum CHAB5714]